MADLTARPLGALGAEVEGVTEPRLDEADVHGQLQALFDRHGVLVFRALDLSFEAQLRLAEVLIQKELGEGTPREDRWYVEHQWRTGDLVVWDNLAVQHGRPNVTVQGPTRTLRKVAAPMPVLTEDEIPTYAEA